MKKLEDKNQRDVPARAGLRALRLQELLFGGGASTPVPPTSQLPLGTSLPLAGSGGEPPKVPWGGGE
jgi:hypothetical protein